MTAKALTGKVTALRQVTYYVGSAPWLWANRSSTRTIGITAVNIEHHILDM